MSTVTTTFKFKVHFVLQHLLNELPKYKINYSEKYFFLSERIQIVFNTWKKTEGGYTSRTAAVF
jgi:hypothetical protein